MRIDSHHHIWDLSVRDQEWIAGEAMQPIRRNFSISDLEDVSAASRIDRTILVQTVTDYTETPSPHHPIGAKGVGESPNVGGVPAFSNAVHDAFRAFGLRQAHMPHDHWRIWKIANQLGLHG